MKIMQWLTLIVFGLTILVVITNVIDSTLAALIGVAIMCWVGIMTEADAFKYVDWNVMAILVGIWIIAGYSGKSGVPSWLSIQALKLSGGRCKVEHVTDDLPAAAIIAAAKGKKCNVLLIASHDRHGFRDSMLGSQTGRVLAQSTVTVMVHRQSTARRAQYRALLPGPRYFSVSAARICSSAAGSSMVVRSPGSRPSASA